MVRNKNKYGIKPLLGLSTSGPTNTDLLYSNKSGKYRQTEKYDIIYDIITKPYMATKPKCQMKIQT